METQQTTTETTTPVVESTTQSSQPITETAPQAAAPSENIQSAEQVTAPVSPEPVKPFELPTEQAKSPFEGLKEEDFAKNFKGDKKALLKHLGYKDFGIDALDYYEKTGSLAEYAEVKSVDWTKKSHEQLIAEKLREQYSAHAHLGDEKIQRLIQADLRKKYMVGDEHDSESEEVQIARLQMEIEAEQYRNERLTRQQQFKAPETPAQTEATEVPREQQLQQARENLLKDAAVQQLFKDKKLSFGDPQSPYNYEVNPDDVLSAVYDQNRWLYEISEKNEKGEVKMSDGVPVLNQAKMLKIAAYAQNMEKIEQSLIAYGKTLGEKKLVEEAENVQLNQSSGSETQPQSFWKEWAGSAKITNS